MRISPKCSHNFGSKYISYFYIPVYFSLVAHGDNIIKTTGNYKPKQVKWFARTEPLCGGNTKGSELYHTIIELNVDMLIA